MSNLDWEDSGPTLRNLPEGAVHFHFWSLLETIVWVATRDERAVTGAAGYLRDHNIVRGKVDYSDATQTVLGPFLRDDVSGHHENCAGMWEDKPCRCGALGRARYCRCSPAIKGNPDWVCRCVEDVFRSVRTALLDGFPVSGKPDTAVAWRGILSDEMAAARFFFDRTGIGFVPGFTDLRLRIDAVKERWPAGFAEMPLLAAAKSRQQAAVDRLAEVNIVGRPPDNITGLKLFCDRLDTNAALPNRVKESQAIEKLFPVNGRGDAPKEKSIRGWIGPHHKLLASATDRASGLANARASALRALEEKVSAKIAAGKR